MNTLGPCKHCGHTEMVMLGNRDGYVVNCDKCGKRVAAWHETGSYKFITPIWTLRIKAFSMISHDSKLVINPVQEKDNGKNT